MTNIGRTPGTLRIDDFSRYIGVEPRDITWRLTTRYFADAELPHSSAGKNGVVVSEVLHEIRTNPLKWAAHADFSGRPR